MIFSLSQTFQIIKKLSELSVSFLDYSENFLKAPSNPSPVYGQYFIKLSNYVQSNGSIQELENTK